LSLGVQTATAGAAGVLASTRRHLDAAQVDVDYLELVDPTTFESTHGPGAAILLVAAHVGTTRLIDNVRLVLGAEGE
jgi:pantoate--beta-alanine ligase